MQRPGILLHLLSGFCLLVALPVAVLGWHQATRTERDELERADRELRSLAETLGRSIEEYVAAHVRVVESLALQAQTDPEPLAAMRRGEPILHAARRPQPGFVAVFYADSAATAVAADPPLSDDGRPRVGISYKDRDYYLAVKQTLRTSYSAVAMGRSSHVAFVAVVAPVLSRSREFVGFALGALELGRLNLLAEQASRTLPDADFILLDQHGKVVVHPDASARAAMAELGNLPLYQPAEQPLTIREAHDERGIRVRAVATPLHGELKWRLIVKRPMDGVLLPAAHARQGWVIAAGIAILFGLLFAITSVFFVARPMVRLSELATAIGGGDLTAPLPPRRWWLPRETVRLQDSMGAMLSELRGSLRMFVSLREGLERTRGNIENLVSEQEAAGASQSRQLQNVREFADGLQQTSDTAAKNAQEVMEVAARAGAARDQGTSALSDTAEQLGDIQKQFASVAELTLTLQSQVERIVEINDKIEAIAGRSNVLSINAAIEAMRAGDAGKGFAIIAKEIRDLSDSSQRSREQIKDTIRDVKEELRRASDRSQEGARQLEVGLNRLASSEGSLRLLAETVNESARSAERVAHSVSEQQGAIERISQSISSLKDVTGQLMARGERAGQAAQEMGATLQTLVAFLERFRLPDEPRRRERG